MLDELPVGWTVILLRHATYGSVDADCGDEEQLYVSAVNRVVKMHCTKQMLSSYRAC